MYPALPLNLFGRKIPTLLDQIDEIQSDSFSPILCPCICPTESSWEHVVLHEFSVSEIFVFQHILSRNLLQLFKQNKFECYHYVEEDNSEVKLFFIHASSSRCPVILNYTFSSSKHTIELLRLPFSSVPSDLSTPLYSLLHASGNSKCLESTEDLDSLSEAERFERLLSEEIRLNYAIFCLLSYYYHLSNNNEMGKELSFCTDLFKWERGSGLPDRQREIAFLMLRQALHTSQHFYTFLPYSIRPRNEYMLSPLPKRENKFAITIHRDRCDPLSKEANTYLLQLLRYNLSTLYHSIPETAMATLCEIASLFLDYEYINNSQGFFTACNSSGNRISYGYNFCLFFVFLHNFSSSSFVNSSSLSQHSVEFDYFLVSPDSFRSTNVNAINSIQRDVQGRNQRKEQEQEQEQEQELDIQNLFKSCFMYSIYNAIYSNRSVKSSELKRFLTADNCLSKDINVDMTHLLRVFRVLNDDDRKYIDDEVYRSINLTDCIIFDEYLVVRFNDYPVFIKPELIYQRRSPGTKEVSFCFIIHLFDRRSPSVIRYHPWITNRSLPSSRRV